MTTLPNLDIAVCWTAGRLSGPVQPYWCSVIARTEGALKITRGKQYELDQVQPGECTLTLRNDDGALDPSNGAGIYAGSVLPYRMLRVRAQYPPTANLLTADQAVPPYDGVGTLPANVGAYATTAPTVTQAGVYGISLPFSDVGEGMAWSGWTVKAGVTYSASLQAYADASTASASLGLEWRNAAGGVIRTDLSTAYYPLPQLGSGQYAAMTVTGTAPANAAGARVVLVCEGPTNFSYHLYAFDVQLEEGASSTSFVTPGTWYSLFTGSVERWPQAWGSGGNYGTVDVTAVDAFGAFAAADLQDPFTADLLALGPRFLYPLNEASGSLAFADASGTRGPIVVSSGLRKNTSQSGTAIQSADDSPQGPDGLAAVSGGFVGGTGPVVHTTTPTSGSVPVAGGALAIPADPATGLYGPPQGTGWTRIIAARVTGIPASGSAYAWSYNDRDLVNQAAVSISNATPTPTANLIAQSDVTASAQFPNIGAVGTGTTVTDGDWHLYGFALSADGSTLTTFADMQIAHNTASASPPLNSANPAQVAAHAGDVIGALYGTTDQAASQWIGDLAYVCEFGFVLTGAQWMSLATSWRNAWAGDTTDQRYARALNWAGIGSDTPRSIGTGRQTDMGPAVDVHGGTTPTNLMTALEDVVETEFGQHFIAADGTITFQSRGARFNPSPVATFGEQSGEIAYLGAVMDFDPTHVGNNIQATATYGGAVYTSSDSASQAQYGVVTLQRTVNALSASDLQYAAQFLKYRYNAPELRLEAITVDCAANPTVLSTLLTLDLGACVTVNRRPSNAPPISLVCYLEQVVWDMDDTGALTWTAQLTNGARSQFCVLNDAVNGLLDSTAILGY